MLYLYGKNNEEIRQHITVAQAYLYLLGHCINIISQNVVQISSK